MREFRKQKCVILPPKIGAESTAIWNNSNSEYFNQLLNGVFPHATQPANITAKTG
jgi:hypothetical protein